MLKTICFHKENGQDPSEAYFFIGKQAGKRLMVFDIVALQKACVFLCFWCRGPIEQLDPIAFRPGRVAQYLVDHHVGDGADARRTRRLPL